jgi:hypothetical protein
MKIFFFNRWKTLLSLHDSAFGNAHFRSIENGQFRIFNFQLFENAECAMPNGQ